MLGILSIPALDLESDGSKEFDEAPPIPAVFSCRASAMAETPYLSLISPESRESNKKLILFLISCSSLRIDFASLEPSSPFLASEFNEVLPFTKTKNEDTVNILGKEALFHRLVAIRKRIIFTCKL